MENEPVTKYIVLPLKKEEIFEIELEYIVPVKFIIKASIQAYSEEEALTLFMERDNDQELYEASDSTYISSTYSNSALLQILLTKSYNVVLKSNNKVIGLKNLGIESIPISFLTKEVILGT